MGEAAPTGPGEPKADKARATGPSTSRQVAVSSVSNWVRMGVQIGTGFFLLAYMLDKLDEDQYGVFRVTLVFAQAIIWLSFGMSGAVLRLGSQSIAAGDWERLSNTLSAVRALLVAGAAIGLVGVFAASALLMGVLNVPEAYRASALVLAQLLGFASVTQLVRIVYSGALMSRFRYDLVNGVLAVEALLHVGFVVACFESGYVSLEVIGIGRAGTGLLALVAFILLRRWILPEADLSFRRLNRRSVREVLRFGGWAMMNMTTRTALDAGGPPIVSATLGVARVTHFSIPLSIAQYLVQIVGALTSSFWPAAAKYAVQRDRQGMARLYLAGTRFAVMLLMAAVVPLVVFGEPLIRYLKRDLSVPASEIYALLLVSVALSSGRCIGMPAEHVIWGGGRVAWVSLSSLVAAIVGIPAALAVAVWTDWGLAGIMVALLAPTALRGLVYLPVRMWHEAGVAYRTTVLRSLVPPVLAAVVPAVLAWQGHRLLPPGSLFQVLLYMVLCSAVYVPFGWFLALTADDRRLALGALRSRRPKPPTSDTPGLRP